MLGSKGLWQTQLFSSHILVGTLSFFSSMWTIRPSQGVLGSISWLLGLAIERNRTSRTLSISQKSYIETILRRFNLENAKSLSIPMDPNTHFSYREAIGALNWIAVGSRPDIAFVVGQLAQYLENPGRVHWEAAKRVMRYRCGWSLTRP